MIELEPDGKAAAEIIAIAKEILAIEPDNSYEFSWFKKQQTKVKVKKLSV